jgi:hypothetical protein
VNAEGSGCYTNETIKPKQTPPKRSSLLISYLERYSSTFRAPEDLTYDDPASTNQNTTTTDQFNHKSKSEIDHD